MNKTLATCCMMLFFLVACTNNNEEEEMIVFDGTIIDIEGSSFIMVKENFDINEKLTLDEAFEKFGRDEVLQFSIENKELEKLNIGDQVEVYSNGNFNDLEPPRASAEKVELIN